MLSQVEVLYGLAFLLPAFYLIRRHFYNRQTTQHTSTTPQPDQKEKPLKSIMQAPNADLAPPRDDPFTPAQLKQYDGSNPRLPILVAIKGTVFDVSHKADIYGQGRSYNIFAGKDASKGLGMSSLKPEHAVSDYSGLSETDLKVLNDWFEFFKKRYNIVGRVIVDPESEAGPSSSL